MRKKSLGLLATAIVVIGALMLWGARWNDSPKPLAGATRAAPTPAGSARSLPPLPGVQAARVTEALAARWKTEPQFSTDRAGLEEHLVANYPGDSKARLSIYITVPIDAPEKVIYLSCGRKRNGGVPATATTPAELADYCLRGTVGKGVFRDVTAWAEHAVPRRNPTSGRVEARQQFAGYYAEVITVSGDMSLALTPGAMSRS